MSLLDDRHDGRAAVLVLDYPSITSRARLTDILTDKTDADVISLLARKPARGTALADYTDTIFGAVDPDQRVCAVVAYCMTTPLGHEIASRATVPGLPPPELISVNGSPCPADFVMANFHALWAKFTGPNAENSEPPRLSITDLRTDPDGALAEMRGPLSEAVTRSACREMGVEELTGAARTIMDDLTDNAHAWLQHITAAHNAAFPDWPGRVTLLCSEDHSFTGPWPGAASTRRVSIPCLEDDMLDHPDTVAVLVDTITSSPGLNTAAGHGTRASNY